MTNDDLEFSISQYIDNALAPAERAALEVRFAQDADARTMLDEYRRLDAALKSMPMPAVPWDALANSISSAIDSAEAARQEQAARSYRMPTWIRMAAMPLALAASLLIVAGVGVDIYFSHQSPSGWNNSGVRPRGNPTVAIATSSATVDLPTDKATGPVVELVAIGPSAPAGGQPISVQYENDAPSGSSSISVASGGVPAHDSDSISSYDME